LARCHPDRNIATDSFAATLLGAMELRQITPLVLSEFILELQQAGAGAATIRSCLGLLQSVYARAVEWDRASANVVKLIAKPRFRIVRFYFSVQLFFRFLCRIVPFQAAVGRS
jgi:hypothetical protein